MTDDELIEGFEGARLGTFHHTDHVRVAWIYLRRLGLYRALAAVSEGLMRLAAVRKTFNADWERERGTGSPGPALRGTIPTGSTRRRSSRSCRRRGGPHSRSDAARGAWLAI